MDGLKAYKEASLTTQNKGKLIVMLYDGAVKFMKMAIQNIEDGDYEKKSKHLIRAQDIITELNAVLDMEGGGEIAQNLRKLYDFMHRRLIEANVKNDTGKIREVVELMEELNQGWKAIT